MEDYVKEHSNEKFLWFVDSAAGGKQLAARLKERGVSAAYLDAEQKRSVLWRKICTESRFDENVLICTRVLDAGANLNDAALKNIVVGFLTVRHFFRLWDGSAANRMSRSMSLFRQFRRIKQRTDCLI